MDALRVIIAAAVGFGIGALWYAVLSKAWIRASGVPVGQDGLPARRSKTFAAAFLCILVVAVMMHHLLGASGVEGIGAGFVSGAGIGLFLITPWITLNVLFSQRPIQLAAIDGGYATLACAAMGAVLTIL